MSKNYTMPQFQEALENMASDVRRQALGKAAIAGGTVVEAQAKININKTFNHPTGALGNSMVTKLVSDSGDRAMVEIGPTVVYGRIQELGGTIKPLFKKMLHWVDESGQHHQAWQVTLPARPYLAPAMNDNVNRIIGAISEQLRQAIEGGI